LLSGIEPAQRHDRAASLSPEEASKPLPSSPLLLSTLKVLLLDVGLGYEPRIEHFLEVFVA
jgi:hypothetical protein